MITRFPIIKRMFLPMLFVSIQIENFIHSLLHAEIGIGNKIINSFYNWITKHVELLSDEVVELSNVLIDLQIEFNQNKKSFEKLTKKNCTTIVDLRIDKKLIDSLLKEKDDNNCLLIIENYKLERLNEIKEKKSKINE